MLVFCPNAVDESMRHSRLNGLGYWYEGDLIPNDHIQGRCEAKGGSQVMFKRSGILPHVVQLMEPYGKVKFL